MAATAASDLSDGPVLSLINKRLRALRKKLNRIHQLEESIAKGKSLVREQEDVLRSKPGVVALIDELDKLRQPLSAALQEELSLALQRHQLSPPPSEEPRVSMAAAAEEEKQEQQLSETESSSAIDSAAVDLLPLLYFGSLFDLKPQREYTSTMLMRMHERGCCLTYDYVTDDDAADLLVERDLDSISILGELLTSRPLNAGVSHHSALQRCIEHAKLWLAKSDQPIDADAPITYAGLREKLNKIMSSHYFTITPEIKAPGEMAAAATNYVPYQMSGHCSVEQDAEPVQVEGSVEHEDGEAANIKEHGSDNNASIPVEEVHKEDSEPENPGNVIIEQEVRPNVQMEQNQKDVESKDHQINNRRSYPNQKGGHRGGNGGGWGARRGGYPNGRGRNGGRGNGSYPNGGNHYQDQYGSYYQKNYHNSNNNRGRQGRAADGQYHYVHPVVRPDGDLKLAS